MMKRASGSCLHLKNDFSVQQVCAYAALTVRTNRLESKNPISEADLEWIFARNYEETEQLRIIVKEKDMALDPVKKLSIINKKVENETEKLYKTIGN